MKPTSMMILLLFSFWIHANDHQTDALHIYTENFPPYNYMKNGQVTGINAKLTSLMCIEANIACQFELLPWNRAFKLTSQLKNKGLISTSRSPEREDLFLWVGPLKSSDTYLYKLKSRKDIKAASIEDAKKYSIGIQRNGVYTAVLANLGFKMATNVMNFTYKNDELDLFINGKIDLVVGSDITLDYALAEKGESIQLVEKLVALPTQQLRGNYLAINKSTNRYLVLRLQQALDRLKQNGVVNEVVAEFASPQ